MKKINEPEIEQILLPLLRNEIELLQATTPNKPIIADIKNNTESEPEPHQDKIPHHYKDVMNINELVEYIGISKSTIHKYTSAGTITFYKQGKFLCFDRIEIDEWRKEKRGYNVDDMNKEALKSLTIKRK